MKRTAVITFLSLALSTPAFAQTNIPTLTPLTPNPSVIQPSAPSVPIPATESTPPPEPLSLPFVWDSDAKTYDAKSGDSNAPFVFSFTNISSSEVVLSNLATTCGCTVAQMPQTPWVIAPGTNGEIKANMTLVGKPPGRTTKYITVNSSHGPKTLSVTVNMPTVAERGDRDANMELAKADRQAVFKGDCRSCHIDQGVGKLGKELYAADCGICHDAVHRAEMVPDLRIPKAPRDRDYWVTWITYGRGGTMMPAFGEKDGGPLSKEQIDSLVDYLAKEFPQAPAPIPVPAPNNAAPAGNPTPGAGQ